MPPPGMPLRQKNTTVQLYRKPFPLQGSLAWERGGQRILCLHSPASPIPTSTTMLPLLNLAVGFLRGCRDFEGQKLLPCALTFQLTLYLSTKKWNFLGAFFALMKKCLHSRVLNFKFQVSLETASISAVSTDDLSCQLPHLSQGQNSPRPDG